MAQRTQPVLVITDVFQISNGKQLNSLDLNIPVAVIGTGLGPEKANFLFPPCAPHGENHKELKPTCAHFVATKYGHAG
ncbi:hypothetical protein JHK82_025488 [Glycine max]|nr:hypothetical protein JHK86_025612 [Glycine max]KAG5134300.1 hypothetical protein JHK82_025488 [Glycine max]